MYTLYILKNETSGRYYIGSTSDLDRRLKQHERGTTRTTKILETKKLVYTETYNTLIEVRNREKKLKSYKSRKYLDWLVSKPSI